MTPEQELVERLASKSDRVDVMRSLLGGANATELRSIQLTDAAFDALACGLEHRNPQVRWWSIQLLDHCADLRAIEAIVPLLDDPVARVRRNAVHALSCAACKPTWSGQLAGDVIARIAPMAEADPNHTVRTNASVALRCRGVLERDRVRKVAAGTSGDDLVAVCCAVRERVREVIEDRLEALPLHGVKGPS